MSTTRKRGLGRGLDALLGGVPEGHRDTDNLSHEERAALREIAVDALQPGKHQPRQHFDENALAQLSASIRAQGVVQPLLVRSVGRQRYEIVAGERRWRAARAAGLATVPAIVRDIDDQGAMAVALVENIQRADLNPLEEAAALQRLIDDCGLTHAQAAEAVGRSRAAISNLLRLFDLPADVQDLVRDGRLSFGHARALLAAPEDRRSELAEYVVAHGLSVRQTEALASKPATAPRPQRQTNPYTGIADDIADRVGLPVSIRAGASGRGRLTISFRDRKELEALLARLGK